MRDQVNATIEELHHEPGKAEIVEGQLIRMAPTGDLPGIVALNIVISLRAYEMATARGRAYGDNVGFEVDLPGRQSFSPDAAFYVGPRSGGNFLQGAPWLAVEVRSQSDYGPQAEREMAEKRSDYFAAGTQVVWDVDVLRERVVRVYRASDPDTPVVYRQGEIAEAEPALPQWRLPINEVFAHTED